MRVTVVYCHPCAESLAAALRDRVVRTLEAAGHEVRLLDLYAMGFDPVMRTEERRAYEQCNPIDASIAPHIEAIRWCQGLVFIYPTWWYGLPAMLKGWLDRVWRPHVAFTSAKEGPIRPLLTNVRALAVVTTTGAPWWWLALMGHPGRRTIMRGVRALCDRRCRSLFLAHYDIDRSTDASRSSFLDRVGRRIATL